MVGNRGTGACAFALFLALAIDPAIGAPVRTAQTSAAEIEFWRSVESTKDPAELKAYLQSYPNGQFAPLARLRLERLLGTTQQGVNPAGPKTATPSPPQQPVTPPSASANADFPPPPPARTRGWIGAEIRTVSEARARELNLAKANGVDIISLIGFGPAARSGLKPGDTILSVDGEPLIDHLHLIRLVSATAPGKSTELLIVRNTQGQTLTLTVGNYFEDQWAAAHRGDPLAMLHLGNTYGEGSLVAQDHGRANNWFRKAADAGNAAAMNAMGDRHRFGQGFARDDREAIRWYRRAAEAGFAESMFSLGLAYYRGQGVERDYAESVRWYRRAMEKDHGGAIHNYALLLQEGHGVAKDESLAVTHFRKAAALNRPESFYMLGEVHLSGRGVAKDPHEAARWFQEATKRGVGHGHTGLGRLYESGEGGLPRSQAEAIKHYRKAAEAGHDFALERLKALKASAYDPQEMQALLANLGFDPGPADGRPGAKTVQAIREFQKSRGLKIDGTASLALVGQLRDALKQKAAQASAKAPGASAGPASDLGKLQHLERLD